MKKAISLLLILTVFSLAGCKEEAPPVFHEQAHFEVPFQAQYIRTDGDPDGSYPAVIPVFDRQTLDAYYRTQRGQYDLERREAPSSDSTIGFLDACDGYDDAFFSENYLLLLVLQEPSGSNRHQVCQVLLDIAQQTTEIYLERITPEVFTDDMAGWHIFLELQRREDVAPGENVTVYMDGTQIYGGGHTHQPAAEPQTVSNPASGYCGNIWTTLYIDGKEYGFMGGHSVTLTDILINLDYDPDKLCNCLPEYRVDTEFGHGYGINLTKGYARCDQGQADLTEDQIHAITEIVRWAKTTGGEYHHLIEFVE